MFEELKSVAQLHLQKTYGLKDVSVIWKRPQEASHGDLATPVALSLAKELKKTPQDIAKELAAALALDASVEKSEVAGPGYVNIWMKPESLLKELSVTRSACTAKVQDKKAKPVIIEYSQPNIAKPLAIHHLIGTVVGQAMVNLYRHTGHTVLTWNYIGDWGSQFGKLAVAYEKWGNKKPVLENTLDDLLALYVRFHKEVETDKTLEDEGREAFRKLEAGDKDLRAFWKDVVTVTKASLGAIYERLHVSFDLELGESFYEDKMQPILEEGKKKKVFTEGEGGSLIVKFPEEKNMPPYLVLKGDGATLYSTRDLAQMRYRIDTYSPQSILIFTDIAQKLHFEQLIETCTMLGWKLPEFENVLFGRMSFTDQSMSTRKGTVLKLEHVLDEGVERAQEVIKEHGDAIQADDTEDLAEMMGTGAIVYGVVSQNRKMNMIFDWKKFLSLEGNSAPYLQYTHARAKSVLRKAEDDGAKAPKIVAELSDKDRVLMNTLLRFEDVLQEALDAKMPHILGQYIFSLCQDFNAFYNADPILQAAEPTRGLRLFLTALTASVIKTGLSILTIRVPERM